TMNAIELQKSIIKTLLLIVEDGGDGISYDHADWADARFVTSAENRCQLMDRLNPKLFLPQSLQPRQK
ncbi:MAG TPA: NPCBM/NEW2 domain-containing protein, partial [Verrucomicrobiota bacterium]|nr:NPCBM/NEW2 domain-containing protein [Verrucomicrobiota bacterium]